ncbi:MAG: hypothetical protein P9M14_09095 [Candidatus Alcyoniella australis]|nr:hypothetical protein [Candidatus Alcyoniella australis]
MKSRADRGTRIATAVVLVVAVLWTTLPQALQPRLIPDYCLEELYAAWNMPGLVTLFHDGLDLDEIGQRLQLNRGSSESAAGSLTYVLLLWPCFALFGLGPLGLNVATFLVNLLLLAGACLICRRLFDARTAILLLALMAAIPWYRAIALSRNFFGLSALVGLAACAAALYAIERRRRVPYLAAGLLVGMTIHGYVVNRLLLLVVPLYCALVCLAPHRGRKLDKQGLRLCGWLVLGVLIVLGPSLADPGNVLHNAFTGDQESPFKAAAPDEPLRDYLEVVDPLRNAEVMFGSPNFWFNSGGLHWTLMALIALGATSIALRRQRTAALFALYGLCAVAGIIFFAQWVTPSRVGGCLIPLLFLAAWGLREIALLLERLVPRLKPWGSSLIVAAALCAVAWPSARAFDRQALAPGPWQIAAQQIETHGLRTSHLLSSDKQRLRAGKVVFLELAHAFSDQDVAQMEPYLRPVGQERWTLSLPVHGPGPYELMLVAQHDELDGRDLAALGQQGYRIEHAGEEILLVIGPDQGIAQTFDLLSPEN